MSTFAVTPFRAPPLVVAIAGAALIAYSAFAHGTGAPPHPSWPATARAQQEFATSEVFIDRVSRPGSIWLISAPVNGDAHAEEFFTGEQVPDVRFDANGERISFVDARGHEYKSVEARTLEMDLGNPASHAEWNNGDAGHDVILGGHLHPESSPSAASGNDWASLSKKHFDGQPSCDSDIYIARTEASTWRDSEQDFAAKTKIIANFDKEKSCWDTKPLGAVDLEDNSFLLITRTRVFRLDSKDLTAWSSAPDLKIINIKDK